MSGKESPTLARRSYLSQSEPISTQDEIEEPPLACLLPKNASRFTLKVSHKPANAPLPKKIILPLPVQFQKLQDELSREKEKTQSYLTQISSLRSKLSSLEEQLQIAGNTQQNTPTNSETQKSPELRRTTSKELETPKITPQTPQTPQTSETPLKPSPSYIKTTNQNKASQASPKTATKQLLRIILPFEQRAVVVFEPNARLHDVLEKICKDRTDFSFSGFVATHPETHQILEMEKTLGEINLFEIKFDTPVDQVDDPKQVVFYIVDNKKKIRGATLDKLIDILLSIKQEEILYEFLLTYRTFCTPQLLFDGIISRIRNSKNDSPEDGTHTDEIIFRSMVVLKKWISDYWYDFQKNPSLLQSVQEFLQHDISPAIAVNLQFLLNKKVDPSSSADVAIVSSPKPVPSSILPRKMEGDLWIVSVNPIEIARQMALINYDLYNAIQTWECLEQVWNKEGKEEAAPNILECIKRFNEVSNWVATTILKQSVLKKRIKVLSWFIEIAEKSLELNDFSSVFEIVSGLNQGPIIRLKQTWAGLSERKSNSLTAITEIIQHQNNHKNLREHLRKKKPPCIPYIGMYLMDLTFVQEGNKSIITEHNLINFDKYSLIASIIREMTRFQNTPYHYKVVPQIRDYLTQELEFLDDIKMYELSQVHEPRK